MAVIAVLGGLVGGAVVLATIRSKRNSMKKEQIHSMKLK
jgi:hypothetical protein